MLLRSLPLDPPATPRTPGSAGQGGERRGRAPAMRRAGRSTIPARNFLRHVDSAESRSTPCQSKGERRPTSSRKRAPTCDSSDTPSPTRQRCRPEPPPPPSCTRRWASSWRRRSTPASSSPPAVIAPTAEGAKITLKDGELHHRRRPLCRRQGAGGRLQALMSAATGTRPSKRWSKRFVTVLGEGEVASVPS